MAISTNVKDNAFSRSPLPISAYYPIARTDWGQVVTGFVNGNLAYNAGAGSLAMSTARAAITWITAQGESSISAEATVSIAAGTGAFTITQPTVPTNGATVIGWRVYSSSGGAGTPLLNVAANSTTQVQSNLATTQGTLLGFPVATTAVQVLIYGAGAAEPTINNSGAQVPLPSVPASGANLGTVEISVKVPLSFSVDKGVFVKMPNSSIETAGISFAGANCRKPLWPVSTPVVAGDNPNFIFTAGTLFRCTVAGTTSSLVNFPAGFATAAATGTNGVTTVTDNTATWTLVGDFATVALRWNNSSNAAATPVVNEYDLWQLA